MAAEIGRTASKHLSTECGKATSLSSPGSDVGFDSSRVIVGTEQQQQEQQLQQSLHYQQRQSPPPPSQQQQQPPQQDRTSSTTVQIKKAPRVVYRNRREQYATAQSPARNNQEQQQQQQQAPIDADNVTSTAEAVTEVPGAIKTTINIGFAMNHENDQENLKQLSLAPVQVITSRPLRLSEVEEMDAQEETPNNGGGDRTDNRPINGEPELACIVQDQEMEEDEARSEATFRYTVENISKMKDFQLTSESYDRNIQLSPACYVQNLPWKIMVMPRVLSRSLDRQQQRTLGFYLQCNGESESTSWSCYGVAELRLLSCKEGQEAFSRKIQHLFCSKENDWGYRHFINWQDVLDPDRGFIKDDSITLEVHVVADAPHGDSWDSNR